MNRRRGIIAALSAVAGSFMPARAQETISSGGTGTFVTTPVSTRITPTISWNIETGEENDTALIVRMGKREVRLTGKEIMDALESK